MDMHEMEVSVPLMLSKSLLSGTSAPDDNACLKTQIH